MSSWMWIICARCGDGRNAPPFETALFVASSVVSVNRRAMSPAMPASRCFATDGPAPEVAAGAPPGSRYDFFGDEHGKLVLPPGAARPAARRDASNA